MFTTRSQASGAAQGVAWAGGAVFVGSLIYFAYCYAIAFGRPAAGGGPDRGAGGPVLVDLALFTLFALHHSLFARAGVKGWIRRVAPAYLERSLYVWVGSLLFIATCACWREVPGVVWQAAGAGRLAFFGVQAAAGLFTLIAARRLDVLELAGIRQVTAPAGATPHLDQSGPYALVRHPVYLGWFAVVWLTPVMTGTRFVFAIVSCAYLVIAVPFEERDLRRTFGGYDAYARRVRWRILPGVF